MFRRVLIISEMLSKISMRITMRAPGSSDLIRKVKFEFPLKLRKVDGPHDFTVLLVSVLVYAVIRAACPKLKFVDNVSDRREKWI